MCYGLSYSMVDDAVPMSEAASVWFQCGTPELLDYAVQKFFVSTDESSSVTACEEYSVNFPTGQIFEAFPTTTCAAQWQSDGGTTFSVQFGTDESNNPHLTYFFDSQPKCAAHFGYTSPPSKTKTSYQEMYTTCEDQSWPGDVSVYSKWVYNYGYHLATTSQPTAKPTFEPTPEPTAEPTYVPSALPTPPPTFAWQGPHAGQTKPPNIGK